MPRGVRLTNEQKEIIREKTNGCLTRQEIADIVGVNVKTITNWQHKLEVTPACHRTIRNGRVLIQAPPEFPTEVKDIKKEEPKSDSLIVTDKNLQSAVLQLVLYITSD